MQSSQPVHLPPLNRDGKVLSDKKIRRLEKNRLSARNCRRKKKEYTQNLQREINILEGENLRLRLQLQIGQEAERSSLQEQERVTEGLESLLNSGATDPEIYSSIEEFKEKFADYGRDRRSAMEFHLRNVERLLMPTTTTSVAMRALQGGSVSASVMAMSGSGGRTGTSNANSGHGHGHANTPQSENMKGTNTVSSSGTAIIHGGAIKSGAVAPATSTETTVKDATTSTSTVSSAGNQILKAKVSDEIDGKTTSTPIASAVAPVVAPAAATVTTSAPSPSTSLPDTTKSAGPIAQTAAAAAPSHIASTTIQNNNTEVVAAELKQEVATIPVGTTPVVATRQPGIVTPKITVPSVQMPVAAPATASTSTSTTPKSQAGAVASKTAATSATSAQVNKSATSTLEPKAMFQYLVNFLEVTPTQAAALKDSRHVAKELDAALEKSLAMLNELRGRLTNMGQDLDAEFSEIRKILTPRQAAKFLVWVANNGACMHMLNELWRKVYPEPVVDEEKETKFDET